jgi:hypothetical protein
MADVFIGNTEKLFNAVADALIRHGANPRTKRDVLATLMDRIGVPLMSFSRYLTDPTIEALFNERGLRRATPEEITKPSSEDGGS